MPELRHLQQEVFKVLILDTKNRVMATETVCKGTLMSAPLHPREVFKLAIKANGVKGIHNHPSGDPTPSEDDISISRKLKQSGEILGIELLDSIIIGDGKYISLREQKLL